MVFTTIAGADGGPHLAGGRRAPWHLHVSRYGGHEHRVLPRSRGTWSGLLRNAMPMLPAGGWGNLCSSGTLYYYCGLQSIHPFELSGRQKQPVQVVLFRQPRADQNASSSPSAVWRLRNVHAPSQMQQDSNLFRDSNLLWKVDCFPTTTDEHRSGKPGQQLAPPTPPPSSSPSWWLCGSAVQGLPAYLFLIDEEDGFRLTWIRDTAWNERELSHRYALVASLWKDDGSDGDGEMNKSGDTKRKETVVRSTSHTHIVVPVSRVDAGWERCAATTTAARIIKAAAPWPRTTTSSHLLQQANFQSRSPDSLAPLLCSTAY